jgi:septal ring-binding cell division protein DamX
MGGNKVWSAPITYRGQQCYRVFWGRYATREAAEGAIGQIPAALRGSKPVVVSIPAS